MFYKRVYKLSVLLTGLISYLVWSLLWRLLESDNIAGVNDNLRIIINLVIGAFFSYGFFIGMVSLIDRFIVKYKSIKKRFFSSTYIEGIWSGFCISKDEIVLVIKQIEQTSYDVFLSGQTFKYNDGNPTYRGTWVSTGASFDDTKHILNYTYSNDKIIDQNTGFANHQFIKQDKKAPDILFGYVSSYNSGGKAFVMCRKHCDLERIPDLQSSIDLAKTFYENHKKHFNFHGYYSTQGLQISGDKNAPKKDSGKNDKDRITHRRGGKSPQPPVT